MRQQFPGPRQSSPSQLLTSLEGRGEVFLEGSYMLTNR